MRLPKAPSIRVLPRWAAPPQYPSPKPCCRPLPLAPETLLPEPVSFNDELPNEASPTRRVASESSPRHGSTTRSGASPRASSGRTERSSRSAPRERLLTTRVALFTIALLAILGGIAGFTVWFNRATYFVGIDKGQVTIFEGRPGGFLWFKPTVVRETTLPVTSVLDANVALLRAGVLESSYTAAQHVVDDLSNEDGVLGIPTTTSTSTTVAATPATTTIAVTTTTSTTTTTTTVPKSKKKKHP